MSADGVREMRRSDIPAIAALHEDRGREGFSRPPEPSGDFLARTLIDTPWADPEIPSLVFVDRGEVLGYLGSTARRLTLDGRPVRVAVGGGYLVAARARGRGIGTELTRRLLAGPQDLTIVDGAAEATRRIWVGAGAHVSVQASIVWRRVLRPGVTIARSGGRRIRVPATTARLAERVAGALDTAARAAGPVRSRLAPPDPGLVTEHLSPQALVDHVGPYRLRPDYDTGFVGWMFDLLDTEPAPSRLVRHLVRDSGGRVLGWYIVMVVPGGSAQVLGLGGAEPGMVVDQLLSTCERAGAAAVEGRLDPGLLEVVRHRRCSLHPDSWTLLHAGEQGTAVVAMLASAEAMFTRFDSNWWNGYLLWR